MYDCVYVCVCVVCVCLCECFLEKSPRPLLYITLIIHAYANRLTAAHLTITSVAFPWTELLDAIASLFTVTYLTITSSAVPLAEHIVYA